MFDLKKFISSCEHALDKSNAVAIVETLMKEAVSDPQSLREGLPEITDEEQLLYCSNKMVIINLRLTPNVHYPPHNHNMPVVIGMWYGKEHNRFYKPDDDQLAFDHFKDLQTGDVVALKPNEIHSVVNCGEEPSLGLHVYMGDLLTQQRHIWNPNSFEVYPYSDEQYFGLTEAFDIGEPFEKPSVCYAHRS